MIDPSVQTLLKVSCGRKEGKEMNPAGLRTSNSAIDKIQTPCPKEQSLTEPHLQAQY